jgi:BirA family biotin operon repressor/biotin-[acetyl-CoA-carboxylase] ligase
LYKIPANTLFVGQFLVFMPECHSTNSEMLRRLETEDLPEGAVLITDHQTAGRGQRGNTWQTEPGLNFTFSLLFKPSFLQVKDQFLLSMAVALAVRDYVAAQVSEPVQIKWPNDILVAGKKIGGILIENQLVKQVIGSAVVGIGLNVNQERFPVATATSLKSVTGHHQPLEQHLPLLLSSLEAWYLKLRERKNDVIREAYREQLYWRGEHHVFADATGEFEGVIEGVAESGRLAISTANGPRSFDIKEIRYIR